MSKHALFSDLSSLLNYLLTMYFGPDEKRMGAFENGFFFFFLRGEPLRKTRKGLSSGGLTFLMNSLFGGFNCAVGRRRQEGAKKKGERGGEGQGFSPGCTPR